MKSLKFWHTLQFKIISTLSIIFLCITAALLFFNFHLYRSELIKTLSQAATNLNKSIESSLEIAMLSGEREKIQVAIDRISQDKHVENLFISDKSGVIRAAANHLSIGKKLDLLDPSCQICHAENPSRRKPSVIYQNESGQRILRTVSPIYNKPACFQCHDQSEKINGVLFLDYSLASYDQLVATYNLRYALVGGITILLITGLTFLFLNKFVVRRIKDLVSRIQSIGTGELHDYIDSSGRDEFAILANSINQMSSSILEAIHKIREHRDYLQNIINSIKDGMIVVDRDFKIVLANEAFLDFVDKKAEEVIGLACYRALGKDICGNLHGGTECPSAIAFAKGSFARVTHSFQDEQGCKILEISASPLVDEKGEITQSIEIIRDVTEKERLENELLQSEKMALVGRLAAGIAHEINNPLAIISTCAEGLNNRINELKDEPLREASSFTEYLQRIDKCVFRCKNIIERLLAFSRPSNMLKQKFDVNTIVLETIQMVNHQAKQEGKNILTSLCPSPITIKGDPNQFGQLLLNLLMNSLDAITPDGRVLISTNLENGHVRLCVEDDGVGIAEKDLQQIFEPFFTTKEVGRGTGLGLSICQRIVKEHGGEIRVESQKGQGSKFEIIIPLF